MTTALPLAVKQETESGVWSWLTTVDHKKIGTLYGISGVIFFIIAGFEALLIRTQLAVPNGTIIDADTYNQLFTMHALMMIFLGVMPMGAAFFNWLVPLMIGARDVAFPRLNAFSFWTFLGGALLLTSSWLFGEAPDVGWFAYAPLTEKAYTVGLAMDFYAVGLILLGVASTVASLNFVVTIINMRAPGMSCFRMPVFVWMIFVVAWLLILSLPVLTIGLTQIYFDRNFGTNFFNPMGGGDPLLWQHLFWIFGHPEVYVLILPSMGIVSEVLPTFARKPIFGYSAIVFAGLSIAVLGFAVWTHHMFTTGLGPVPSIVFSASTMAIGVPTGVKIFNWLATLWGGSIRFNSACMFSIGFLALFTIGGISGVMHASPPIDTQQQDTYFIVAHIHYVLFGGAVFGIFSGFYYWWPKFFGRFLDEKLGQIHFWLFFIGMNLTFFPMHFLGVQGMPRRIYRYDADLGWETWNIVATFGSYLLGVGMLVFLYAVWKAYKSEPDAPDNPWDAPTLEWATSSPPPEHDFDVVPVVEARDPLWYDRDNNITREKTKDEHIHMPPPSYYPLLISIGLLVGGIGMLTTLMVSALGVLLVFYAIWGWVLEPTS